MTQAFPAALPLIAGVCALSLTGACQPETGMGNQPLGSVAPPESRADAGALASATALPDGAPTYHGDVAPILAQQCVSCHTAGSFAPFPLDSYELVHEARFVMQHVLELGTMPPWPPDRHCNDYIGSRNLSVEDEQLLSRWLELGAPEGAPPAIAQPVEAERPAPALDAEMVFGVSVDMAEPYQPYQKTTDDYRCFMVDWPAEETKYVTGFRVRPGNETLVHHVIAYIVSPDQVAQYEALDAAEPGPGYTCFGASGGDSISWLVAWAPGERTSLYPEGTGIRVLPGSKLALQMHYYTPLGPGETDQTGLDFEVADEVERSALMVPYTNISWFTGAAPMTIPAGAANVTHDVSADIYSFMTGFLAPHLGIANDQFEIHSVGLHMHVRGAYADMSLVRKDGDAQCLLDIPDWDFGWQGAYRLQKSITYRRGDRLNISCTWDNSAANQPSLANGQRMKPVDLGWGDGTNDEMCLGILYVTR